LTNRTFAPAGYRSVTPYFIVPKADAMIDFMREVFAAELLNRNVGDGGRVAHAEVRIGDSIVELSEGNETFPPRANTIHIFVEHTDDCYARAMRAGSRSLYEPADMPYGERSAGVEDPFGNHWYIATFAGGGDKGYYS